MRLPVIATMCLVAAMPVTMSLVAAVPALAATPAVKDSAYSAAYWRDVCSGDRPELARGEQERLCGLYLSSFHDAADEYAEAGHRLFCPPDAISAETMRRDFLSYVAELPESAGFLPATRVLVQALMRRYPCADRSSRD